MKAAVPRVGCRDLVVRAGGRVVLDVPVLDVGVGETLAVLGSNGAGKSTLLRALALLHQDRTGTVLLDGAVLVDGSSADRRILRRSVAAVLQRPVVLRGSVRRNVASALLLRGVRRADAYRAADPWMDRLGVGHLAEQSASSLSGGERQRVALARALAVSPHVLLLDEPFAGLDATTRSDLVADLRSVLDDPAMTTVLVTHDRDEAAVLAERTALLVAGRLRQVGATAEVLDQPGDSDCARLIGFVDVLPASLTGLDETVVVRPEHVAVLGPPRAAPALPDDAVVLEGRLVRTVPLGGITRVDVDTAGTPVSCLVAGDVPPEVGEMAPGDVVTLAVPRRHLRRVPQSAPER